MTITLSQFNTILSSDVLKNCNDNENLRDALNAIPTGTYPKKVMSAVDALRCSAHPLRRQLIIAAVHEHRLSHKAVNDMHAYLKQGIGSRLTIGELRKANSIEKESMAPPRITRNQEITFGENRKNLQRGAKKFQFHPKAVDNYLNQETRFSLKFKNRNILEKVKAGYRNLRNIPGFIHHKYFLNTSNPTSKPVNARPLRAMRDNPKLYEFHRNGEHGFSIEPNPSYNDLQRLGDPNLSKSLKHQTGGVSCISWFFHGSVLSKQHSTNGEELEFLPNLEEEERKNVINRALENNLQDRDLRANSFYENESPRTEEQLKSPKDLKRRNSQKLLDEIDSNNTYLTTLLDLNKSHIELLKDMRSKAISYMKTQFNYNENDDQLLMYFHFPTGDVTSTLHLHIRLNQDSTEIEKSRAFSLDDVINHLESNEDTLDLVVNRSNTKDGLLVNSRDAFNTPQLQNVLSEMEILPISLKDRDRKEFENLLEEYPNVIPEKT